MEERSVYSIVIRGREGRTIGGGREHMNGGIDTWTTELTRCTENAAHHKNAERTHTWVALALRERTEHTLSPLYLPPLNSALAH